MTAACFVLTAVYNVHQNNRAVEAVDKPMFCRVRLNYIVYKIDKKIAFLYLLCYNYMYEKSREEEN